MSPQIAFLTLFLGLRARMPQEPIRRSHRFTFALCVLAVLLSGASGAGSPSIADYAGSWVMKLGGRNFLVLRLKDEGGRLTGWLSLTHFQTADGIVFSGVGAGVETGAVVRSSTAGGHLHLVVQDPKKPKDESELDVALTAEDRASLTLVGAPFDPWTITRVHGTAEPAVATDWEANRLYTLQDTDEAPSAEMRRIFDADQAIRRSPDWNRKEKLDEILKQESERHAATARLLATGGLHTGQDYEEAAFIFQHGATADDYLLAHTLALAAMAKGDASGAWIAAATLDRYLQAIGKPQIYGTQYQVKDGKPAAKEPFQKDLIPDALRHQVGVPAIADQERIWMRSVAPGTQPHQSAGRARSRAKASSRVPRRIS